MGISFTSSSRDQFQTVLKLFSRDYVKMQIVMHANLSTWKICFFSFFVMVSTFTVFVNGDVIGQDIQAQTAVSDFQMKSRFR